MSQRLLGLDPVEVGGSSAKASFARALTERCFDGDRLEALVDVILVSRAHASVDPRVRDIASLLGKEELAVGTALGRNPVPLILPCHRVWRSDGGLGGYIFGAAVKDGLAALERTTPVLEGCTSTRIVCRVGCIHGRHMRPDNRVVFASVDDARSVGYRPCKVCRPAA